MIKITALTKSYGEQFIFDDVSFSMGRGERIGLVGRNGHGKTTLFRMILGEEEPDTGEIIIPRHYKIGHLSQHIKFSEDTVLKEACLSLPKSDDGIDETYKVEIILSGLGITEDQLGLDPMKLSGGYQIRLNLAKVLVSEPGLLLLDEPTNYLDIVSIRWLRKFLRDWKNELIIITHDREFMDSVTTHTMAVHRNKLRKIQGPTEKLYSQIAQEEEIHEKTRINEEKKRREVERFIDRFRAQATKASSVQSKIKALEKKEKLEKLDTIRTLDFEFNPAPFNGKRMLEAENISFGFNDNTLFSSLSFSVGKNDRIAIIGKNGKGKTTLLNVLAAELSQISGDVKRHPDLKLAYFGQTNIGRLNLRNTVEEEMMDAHPDYSRAAARRVCGIMMFDGDKALKKIDVLSGGEKSRVLLGKLLLSPANMLLLDEPTNHLDMHSVETLTEAIKTFDGGVIIVTHSEMILDSVANRLIVFDGGEASVFEGTYREFLDKIGWESEAAERGASQKKEKLPGNKRDMRRASDNVKILNRLQSTITGLEGAIVDTEKRVEYLTGALARASESGDVEKISSLSRAYGEANEKIDTLFKELEAITAEYQTKSEELNAGLAEMDHE